MSYEKQTWNKYDDLKTEEENIENGAVVTDNRMNHIEEGIYSHTIDISNPHKVTAAQVRLGNIQNFGLATEDEAKQAISNAKYMTPSLTQAVLSANINSIAYANSADGTDDFTTVYPNLNLLVNTSAKTKDGFFKNFDKVENDYGEVTIKGTNTLVIKNLWDGFSINPRDYKQNDKYTMSMDVMFTSWNFPAGTTLTEFWFGQRYSKSTDGSIISYKRICSIDLPRDPSNMLNQWIRITQTSMIPPYEDPAINTEALFVTKFTGPSEGSFTVRVRKPKQEPGSTATLYMPSASEVTTADYPKYVGFSNTVKTNKSASDYTWFPVKDSELTNKVESHINNKANPHSVTASQVGAYSKDESDQKLAAQKQAIDSHVNNKANPHAVTASQVGAYSKQEIDTKLSKTVMADDSGKVTMKDLVASSITLPNDTNGWVDLVAGTSKFKVVGSTVTIAWSITNGTSVRDIPLGTLPSNIAPSVTLYAPALAARAVSTEDRHLEIENNGVLKILSASASQTYNSQFKYDI